MTSATTGICRAAKSSSPVSTAEKHSSETTVEIAVSAATKLKADWSLAATPNRARRHVDASQRRASVERASHFVRSLIVVPVSQREPKRPAGDCLRGAATPADEGYKAS